MRTRTSFEVEINFLTYFNIMESLVHMTLLFYYQNMHESYVKNKYSCHFSNLYHLSDHEFDGRIDHISKLSNEDIVIDKLAAVTPLNQAGVYCNDHVFVFKFIAFVIFYFYI
jgi:hypothetical protein